MSKKENFTSLANKDLLDKLNSYKKELMTIRFRKSSGDFNNTSRFSQIRKDIARIKTELNMRKIKEAEGA